MVKFLKRKRERKRERERERERDKERERERNSYIYIHFIQMKQSQNCKTLVIYQTISVKHTKNQMFRQITLSFTIFFQK